MGFKPNLKPSKLAPNSVKMSFLGAPLDPQEIVQISQIYEGFKAIFGKEKR